ncbi:hypothetical protein [Rhodococcus qingshengii]|uniref:hypothetical protein n=1 Tax=Rhodococcus qingshengii TaxID=334542 RepID=UPI000815C1CC|nr:hypothetical protein [Rhodococcus qingshengii]SCC69717.1 hypothetical protein GA0061093_12947 [Rhodococcus qingshengii]
MASTITTANGSKIYGPGKLSEERLQHELALRRRANRIPGRRGSDGKGARRQQRHTAAADWA